MNRHTKKAPGSTLLVVDDEPGILQSVALFLELEGFRVLQASNGRQALDQLAKEHCDLVITDLSMPHIDGTQLIQEMHANPAWADIPIVLSSAALPPDSNVSQMADVFLCRPFAISRLIEVVKLLLERCHYYEAHKGV